MLAAPMSAGEQGEATGLTAAEAARRLAIHGPNTIARARGTPAWRILGRQLMSPLVALLAAACAVSAALGEQVDAAAIAAIVALNAAIGFFQEFRAERAIAALRAMTAPRARVIRDGRQALIPAEAVVLGDVLALEAGDVVAADAQVVAAHELQTNEAALTGESTPVRKSTTPSAAGAAMAERADAVFMGTAVTSGAGRAVVTATGMQTHFGGIARLLAAAEGGPTPLEVRLRQTSKVLLGICAGIVGAVAAIGAARGEGALAVFMTSVSLAVAAVPEGLPAVVTIALALGVQRMAGRRVLVRRLQAVETLGCTTVICTDKTGTLTTGVMTVRELWGASQRRLLDAAAACCDAELAAAGAGGVGDPMEVAILARAAQEGIRREAIEAARPRQGVRPFDAATRSMAVRRADGKIYVKGALEAVTPGCMAGLEGAAAAAARMADGGLRVLAVAVGEGAAEAGMELVGLVGLADPPRPEVPPAIEAARAAGVEVVMITGDHPVTARAIARELGILGPTASEAEAAGRVHARATPAEKLTIVRAWKQAGAVVAMTGDGVNDAPALREAHVGIAMGRSGTEVTREAADVVLAEDNFADIVAGVQEGRGIFENIRKTLVYLLAGNAGELAVMLVAAIAGLPLPLLPLQLLWVNLVTDGVPALALVMDPAGAEVMRRPPRAPSEPILGGREWRSIAGVGALSAGLVLGVYAWALGQDGVAHARTLAFSTLVFCELFRALAARSATRTFWEVGAWSNPTLVAAIGGSVAVQVGLLYWPAGRAVFGLTVLGPGELGAALGLGLVPVSLAEAAKVWRRRRGGAG